MPSVENVEKVGIPLPKVKGEKVEKEKRNKYLKAVVYSTMALGQEKGDTWTHVRGRSQAAIMSRIAKDFPFPDFPWDKKPVIKKHFALAFKTGLEQGILVQQVTIVHVVFIISGLVGLEHWEREWLLQAVKVWSASYQ